MSNNLFSQISFLSMNSLPPLGTRTGHGVGSVSLDSRSWRHGGLRRAYATSSRYGDMMGACRRSCFRPGREAEGYAGWGRGLGTGYE